MRCTYFLKKKISVENDPTTRNLPSVLLEARSSLVKVEYMQTSKSMNGMAS